MARKSARVQGNKKQTTRRPTKLFYLFIAIIAVYAYLSLLGPIDPATLAKYHLTEKSSRLLSLTVVAPLIAIWITAYYGFSTFRRYAGVLKGSVEGHSFKMIAWGLGFLAFSLPFNTCLTTVTNWAILRHPSYTIPLTISRSYIALILPLIAFILTSRGAESLTKHLKPKQQSTPNLYVWFLGTIVVSALFTWLLIARPADTQIVEDIYHLPNWLIVVTLAIPYLYTWSRGLLTTYYIGVYQRNVKGRLYRASLRMLSMGILTVIMVNILIQSITTVSTRLYRLHLTPLLIIVYILLALYALGYGWIASGAKKMKKIEEV